jgi:hypothetical protein
LQGSLSHGGGTIAAKKQHIDNIMPINIVRQQCRIQSSYLLAKLFDEPSCHNPINKEINILRVSQRLPVQPVKHWHVYFPSSSSMQVPPFRHGSLSQGGTFGVGVGDGSENMINWKLANRKLANARSTIERQT